MAATANFSVRMDKSKEQSAEFLKRLRAKGDGNKWYAAPGEKKRRFFTALCSFLKKH